MDRYSAVFFQTVMANYSDQVLLVSRCADADFAGFLLPQERSTTLGWSEPTPGFTRSNNAVQCAHAGVLSH